VFCATAAAAASICSFVQIIHTQVQQESSAKQNLKKFFSLFTNKKRFQFCVLI
jgi:hypothetical protein